MMTLKATIGSLAVILLTAGPGLAQHYFGGGNAIPLGIDSTKVTIKFDQDFTSSSTFFFSKSKKTLDNWIAIW
jgi:hypothetical protein